MHIQVELNLKSYPFSHYFWKSLLISYRICLLVLLVGHKNVVIHLKFPPFLCYKVDVD